MKSFNNSSYFRGLLCSWAAASSEAHMLHQAILSSRCQTYILAISHIHPRSRRHALDYILTLTSHVALKFYVPLLLYVHTSHPVTAGHETGQMSIPRSPFEIYWPRSCNIWPTFTEVYSLDAILWPFVARSMACSKSTPPRGH